MTLFLICFCLIFEHVVTCHLIEFSYYFQTAFQFILLGVRGIQSHFSHLTIFLSPSFQNKEWKLQLSSMTTYPSHSCLEELRSRGWHINWGSWRLYLIFWGGEWEKNSPQEESIKIILQIPLTRVCKGYIWSFEGLPDPSPSLKLGGNHCHKFLWLIEGLSLYPDKRRIRKLYFHTLREQPIWPITQYNSKNKNDCAFHLIPIATWKVCHGSTRINISMCMKAKNTYKER